MEKIKEFLFEWWWLILIGIVLSSLLGFMLYVVVTTSDIENEGQRLARECKEAGGFLEVNWAGGYAGCTFKPN